MDVKSLPHEEVESLVYSGRMLDAWELARATGVPLADWPPGDPLRVAAMLASALGASRMAQALDWINWRHDRGDPKRYFKALFSRAAVVPGCDMIPEISAFIAARPALAAAEHSELLAFQATLHANHRDFGPAFEGIDRALELQPEESWIHVVRSGVLEKADRYDEALEAARRALELRPLYRSAVLQCADVLVHLGRDDEAVRLLEDADERTQNAAFASHLQAIFSEREDHVRGLRCLDRVEERWPLMDKSMAKWLAGRRADFHYMAGDIDACLEWCDRKGGGFQKRMAERLREPGALAKKRVRLEVPFVRQHNSTCAPATLAALCAFWGKPHDQLGIADAICHDGTPWHKERRWAEENGFVVREFRLTAAVLRALIDRGLPFTLTTQFVTGAHLQACIGYDDRTGVILLRDPTERHFGEMMVDGLVAAHPISGPRGMVLVPQEESHRLAGIDFPDEAAYDAYHGLLQALDGNDRWNIATGISTLKAVAPGIPLVAAGCESVAVWHQDWPGQLAAIEEQLGHAPEHQPLLLRKAYALRRLGRWQDLREFLERLVARPDADPVFTSELGELLLEDARLLPRALHHLRRAVRRRRGEARVYDSLARCLAKQRRHDEAARLRRVAACLAPGFDPYARAYFDDCRVLRRTAEGIAFLEERTRRIGKKDGGPWITLAQALNETRGDHQAVKVLEEAVATRPDDGELRLRAGALMAGWGGDHRTRGIEWMERVRGTVPETFWLDETGRVAAFLGDRPKALRRWRQLVDLQPLSISAWRGLARTIAEEEGENAAIALLDDATRRHPDFTQLWALKAQWLVGTKRGPLEALDRLLELDPQDRWALRERALRRLDANDDEGAETDAREAVALDPWEAESRGILGAVLARRDKRAEALVCWREALRLRVDYTFAATRLVALADGRDEVLAAIGLIEEEMRRQVSDGDILATYQNLAWTHLEPDVLLAQLRKFCRERPDLWQTWAARIEQALRMRLDDEALLAAKTLAESFPLMANSWLELARVHRAAGRHEDEEPAARQATELSPGWDAAARVHAEVLERLGRADEAVQVLGRACQLDPLNGPNHGCFADALRRRGRRADAVAHLRGALAACPHYAWGWTTACEWAVQDGTTDEMAEFLRAASENHGHGRQWWAIASDAWAALGRTDEMILAVRKGLELAPESADLRDKLAHHLWSEQRFDEALAACEPCAGETEAPTNLRGRRAWILMHSGQPLKGVREMRDLIAREPDYGWGFGELAQWHENRREWRELRDHCQRWLQASAPEVRILGYLGIAELGLGNSAAAKLAFARAHALDPEYVFGARQLLDLQMEAGEFDAAAATLSKLEHYANGPFVVCDGVELELRRGDPAAALRRATALLDLPDPEGRAFAWLGELFVKHGPKDTWTKWLAEQVKAGPVPTPGMLPEFLRTLPPANILREGPKWIDRQPPESEARVLGWLVLIDVAKDRRDLKTLQRWISRRRAELQADARLWNAIATALLACDAANDGITWLKDWKNRPDAVTAATLLNLAAFHDTCPGDQLRSWANSREIRREAFRRFPDANESQAIRAGFAFQLAADGDLAAARAVLAEFDPEGTWDYYRAVGQAARAIVAASEGDETTARDQLTAFIDHFGRFEDTGTVRFRERAVQAVATHLPWARGKAGRLRKRWNLSKAKTANRTPIFVAALLFVAIAKGCMSMAD